MRSLLEKVKPDTMQITPLNAIISVDDLAWKSYQALIVPDIVDDSFEFYCSERHLVRNTNHRLQPVGSRKVPPRLRLSE